MAGLGGRSAFRVGAGRTPVAGPPDTSQPLSEVAALSTDALPLEMRRALRAAARAPRLLIASDYDGTLAPIVDDPMQAHPHPEAVAALRALAELSATSVAVVSGRALRDLATLSRLPSDRKSTRLNSSHVSISY